MVSESRNAAELYVPTDEGGDNRGGRAAWSMKNSTEQRPWRGNWGEGSKCRERREKTLDEFIAATEPKIRPIMVELRKVIRETAPRLREAMKYGMPSYLQNRMVCYIMPAKDHVTFGFYGGEDLPDPKGLLEGSGRSMRHVKVRTLGEAQNPSVRALLKEAVRLDAG